MHTHFPVSHVPRRKGTWKEKIEGIYKCLQPLHTYEQVDMSSLLLYVSQKRYVCSLRS